MADLAWALATLTGMDLRRAHEFAREWQDMADLAGWTPEQTQRIALNCAAVGTSPYLVRAVLNIERNLHMTTLDGRRMSALPYEVGDALTDLRQAALGLAVDTIDAADPMGGWVPETRRAVLDTAEVYLAWMLTGERGDDAKA